MLVIHKASAGSGKTFNLAKEYIKLLLAEKNPATGRYQLRPRGTRPQEHILAITFTNKATDEMAQRIISELAILARNQAAKGTKSDYLDDFIEMFGCTEDELVAASQEALFTLLSDYNYFNVSTIDSFFQTVLRLFARELEIPENYDVELDDKYALSLGIHEMFRNLSYARTTKQRSNARKVTRWLEQFMLEKFDNGQTFNLFSQSGNLQGDVIESMSKTMDENFKLNSHLIRPYFEGGVDRVSEFGKEIRQAKEKLLEQLFDRMSVLRPYLDDTKGNIVTDKFKTVTGIDPATDAPRKGVKTLEYPSATLLRSFEEPEIIFKKNKFNSDVSQKITDYLHLYMQTASIYNTLSVFEANLYRLGMLACVLTFIEDYCKENNLLLLSETGNLLRSIISDDETPFIYERLGYYLKHFLIDEFQDTSRMQWENMRPLLMESLSHAENYDNLIIGDEKQCIYRFRNSDPELLGHVVADEVSSRYTTGAVTFKGVDVAENTNWRSSADVIKFNNSLFTQIAYNIDNPQSRLLSTDKPSADRLVEAYFDSQTKSQQKISAVTTYDNIVQQVAAKHIDKRGYVKVMFAPQEVTASDSDESVSFNAFVIESMLAEIDRQLSAGYRPKDIAVLVRKHWQGEEVIDALVKAMASDEWTHGHIDIVSSDAVSIGSSPVIRLIIAVMRLYLNPPRTVAPASDDPQAEYIRRDNIVRRRLIHLHNRFEYYRIEQKMSADKALEAALKHTSDLNDNDESDDETILKDSAITDRAEAAADMRFPSLTSLVERIIVQYFKGSDVLATQAAFLNAFQDVVIDYEQRAGSDLRSFVAWWDATGSRRSLNSPSGIDAISVMTIHQSKGLEFKCVHIPYADDRLYEPSKPYKLSIDWYKPGTLPAGFTAENIPPMLPLANVSSLANSVLVGAQYRDVVNRRRIDELNVMYVAFTRAIDELIVYTGNGVSKGKDGGEKFSVYLRDAISRLNFEALRDERIVSDAGKLRWLIPLADGLREDVYELGTPCVPKADKGKEDIQNKAVKIDMPPYRPFVNEGLVRVDRDAFETPDYATPRGRGRILHSILEKTDRASRLPVILRRVASRHSLAPHVAAECEQLLTEAIASVADRNWFDRYERVLTERPVTEEYDTRRPDRIVWTSDGHIDVIDYKFTAEDGGEESQNHEQYVRQVRRYCARLKKSQGVPQGTVRGYLWYIDKHHITQVY